MPSPTTATATPSTVQPTASSRGTAHTAIPADAPAGARAARARPRPTRPTATTSPASRVSTATVRCSSRSRTSRSQRAARSVGTIVLKTEHRRCSARVSPRIRRRRSSRGSSAVRPRHVGDPRRAQHEDRREGTTLVVPSAPGHGLRRGGDRRTPGTAVAAPGVPPPPDPRLGGSAALAAQPSPGSSAAQPATARSAARFRDAGQRARVAWETHGRPTALAVVRPTSVDLVDQGRLTRRFPRTGATVTLPALDRYLPGPGCRSPAARPASPPPSSSPRASPSTWALR